MNFPRKLHFRDRAKRAYPLAKGGSTKWRASEERANPGIVDSLVGFLLSPVGGVASLLGLFRFNFLSGGLRSYFASTTRLRSATTSWSGSQLDYPLVKGGSTKWRVSLRTGGLVMYL